MKSFAAPLVCSHGLSGTNRADPGPGSHVRGGRQGYEMFLGCPARQDTLAALSVIVFLASPLTLSLQSAAVWGPHTFARSPNPDFSGGGGEEGGSPKLATRLRPSPVTLPSVSPLCCARGPAWTQPHIQMLLLTHPDVTSPVRLACFPSPDAPLPRRPPLGPVSTSRVEGSCLPILGLPEQESGRGRTSVPGGRV